MTDLWTRPTPSPRPREGGAQAQEEAEPAAEKDKPPKKKVERLQQSRGAPESLLEAS